MNVRNLVWVSITTCMMLAGRQYAYAQQQDGKKAGGEPEPSQSKAAEKASRTQRDAQKTKQDSAQSLALGDLERQKVALIQKYDRQREELSQRLKAMREEQRKALDQLESKRTELLSQEKKSESPANKHSSSTAGPDQRLDRILQHLSAMEQRLERLEKSKH